MYFDYMAGRWATISQSEFETRVTIVNKQFDDASKKEKSLREEITAALKEQGTR